MRQVVPAAVPLSSSTREDPVADLVRPDDTAAEPPGPVRLGPGTKLRWRHVSAIGRPGEMELLLDGEVVGELTPSLTKGATAWGEVFGEEWELALARSWAGHVGGFRRPGGGDEGVRYRGWSLARGRITSPGNGTLSWRRGHFGLTPWTLRTSAGDRVARFRPSRDRLFKTDVLVQIQHAGWRRSDLIQLLIFGAVCLVQTGASLTQPFPVVSGSRPWKDRDRNRF